MRTTLLLLLLLTLAPARARAQSGDASDAATARALFQEGVALARGGQYGDAVERFRRSQALHRAAPVSFNLASALVHTGALVEASEVLEQLLRDASITAALRTAGERLRAQLAPRLARLTVRVEGDASGVRVELDTRGLPDAAIGVAVHVDPGRHEARALRGDAELAHERVQLAEGESRELVLTVAAREPVATQIPPPEVPRAAIEVTPAVTVEDRASRGDDDDDVWLGVGVGVAVLAAGAIATAVVILTLPQGPAPVSGNAMPGVLTW